MIDARMGGDSTMAKKSFKERHLALLQEAQRIARIGSWERDLRSNALWWSDECYRLFGYEPGAIEPSYNLFLQAIHPEDRDMVHAINARSHKFRDRDFIDIVERNFTIDFAEQFNVLCHLEKRVRRANKAKAKYKQR
ncbi:MAG: PAS domain-containing protein [Candidatus Thermochlorobacter sp.]